MSAVLEAGMTRTQLNRLIKAVDSLGALNAEISKLQAEAEILKAQIKGCGPVEILGKRYRAVVSERISSRLDTAVVKGMLSCAQIAQATVTSRAVSLSLYDL